MMQTLPVSRPEYSAESGIPLHPSLGEPTQAIGLEPAVAASVAQAPDVLAATGEDGRPFGLFFALRTVGLIYLGAGVAAGLGYEIWSLLSR